MPRFAPNKVVIWDEDALPQQPLPEHQLKDSRDERQHQAPTAAQTKSASASTVFDAGSAYGQMYSPPQTHSTNSSLDFSHSLESLSGSLASQSSASHRETTNPDRDLSSSAAIPNITFSASTTAEGITDPFVVDENQMSETELMTQASAPQNPHIDAPTPSAEAAASARPTDGRRGREVLDVEFGEPVSEVCVRSFTVRAIAKGGSDTQKTTSFKAALLVVVLRTKAVVFELGEHIEVPVASKPDKLPASLRNIPQEPKAAKWGILHRMTVDGLAKTKNGLVDMIVSSGAQRYALLCLAGRQTGHVQILMMSLLGPKKGSTAFSSSGLLATIIIAAHTTSIAGLKLSPDGSALSTASDRGTLIRVWTLNAVKASRPTSEASHSSSRSRATLKTSLRTELRRGTEQAVVLSMSFAPDCSVLAAASDKGTIHFFNLNHSIEQPTGGAAGSSHGISAFRVGASAAKYLPTTLGQLASQIPSSLMPGYLKSRWSSAQFRIKLATFSAYHSEERSKKVSTIKSKHHSSKNAISGTASPLDNPDPPSPISSPIGGAGAARSTEGAWASLRGRIEDIRRWEPGLDEKVFLTWVNASSRAEPSIEALPASAYHLVALTTSGSWYRIALVNDLKQSTKKGSDTGEGSSVLDMYKNDSRAGDGGGNRPQANENVPSQPFARLEEYQTLRAKPEDNWDWA